MEEQVIFSHKNSLNLTNYITLQILYYSKAKFEEYISNCLVQSVLQRLSDSRCHQVMSSGNEWVLVMRVKVS